MPNRALYDVDLVLWAKRLKIPYFRGVFMRDNLPKKPWKNESLIVNLDNSNGEGTHWVCFKKTGNFVQYFDSYGNLKPPIEVQEYLKNNYISFNKTAYQNVSSNSQICGHLCLYFLSNI